MARLADDDPVPPRVEGLLDSRVGGDQGPAEPSPEVGPPLVPGLRVAEFELLDQAGAGGFSVVWRARDVRSGQVVALKLPRVPEFVSHLRREALVSARIQDPQVVPVLEVRLDHDPPFLVMPYIDGANLALPEEAAAPERIVEAFRAFRKLVVVVAGLHAADVVHGDLKPGNIRFDGTGACHVLDLGLAHLQVSARQQTSLRASVVSVTGEKIGGTLDFMAPEVVSGEKPTRAADVYALGVILHHMVCGRPPAFGVSARALNPYLPPGTSEFLRRMLHPSPAMRVESAVALLADVDRFIVAEERCLRRRNGHARRLVFRERMRVLARGVKWMGLALLLLLVVGTVYVAYGSAWKVGTWDTGSGMLAFLAIFFSSVFVAVLGVTTINAWILGIPEKTYKNRKGHPLWNFMMQ